MRRSPSQPKSDPVVTAAEAADLGGRIRRLRGAARQKDFARRIGISREQLSRIESGAQLPGTGTLRRLAQVTRASLDALVLGGAAAELGVAAAPGPGWAAALAPLFDGTGLRWPRAAAPAGQRADRAWRELPLERRDEIRALVRRIAALAVLIEAVLPGRAARPVTDELARALAAAVIERILAAPSRRS